MEVSIRLRAIAHDLNNPLAVVTGFTQLLSLNESCPAAVHEDIEKVYSELMRVIELVEEMHAYAISLGAKSSQGESRVEAAGSVISGQSGGSASTAGSPSEY
jgi:signal transduction histidine kinase